MTTALPETIHASCVAIAGHGVLLVGPSGSGKSDLALRLIDRGARLVSDDQTQLSKQGAALIATAPPRLSNLIEIRSIGIVRCEALTYCPVRLIIRLADSCERFPLDHATETLLGVTLPAVRTGGLEASAPVKVEWALERALVNAASSVALAAVSA